MAVCIPIKVLKERHNTLIATILTFEDKDDYYENTGNASFSAYRVESGMVVVPFYFGMFFAAQFKLPLNMVRYRGNEAVERVTFGNTLVFRDDQETVVGEALANLQQHRATLLQLYPGYGKTAISSYIAHKIGMVTLIIVHRTFLGNQFKSTFAKYTNATFCIVGDGPIDLTANVYVCMISSMHKLPVEVRKRVGLVVVDEAHCYATGIRVQGLLGLDARYLLFLTATPRTGSLEGVLKAFVGESRVVRKCKKPFDVYCIDTNINPVVETTSNFGGKSRMNFDKYKKSLLYNDELNKFIVYSLIRNQGRKSMIITSEKKHVDLLGNMLGAQGLEYEKFYGNQLTHDDTRILISNNSKVKEGYDGEAGARNYDGVKVDLLYLLVSYKKVGALEQTVGRVLRASSPVVVYFTNNANVSKTHSKVFKKWAKEMPVRVVDVSYNINPHSELMNEVNRFLEDKTTPVVVTPEFVL